MVGMVSIELAESLIKVKAIRAVVVDLAKMLIRFIVIN